MSEYTTTVGIEVHAELKTKSKMFCGCKNDPHASTPNQNICPVCTAQPGTLPVVNEEAVAHVLKVGTAIGAELADFSEFDRKNYFYPDIPKAYQISQYAYPLVTGGEIAGVAITRIHLEEDTARSQHDQGDYSLVDFNRAGVPLMELVTEPVIHDPATAGAFARELQLLLRTLGVSDANMERGEMRVEANISVSKTDVLGTKVEVKNLNSFKSMEQAIEFEVRRHIKLLEAGEVIAQETRGWDEQKGKTYSQRTKETAEDYRYFPDPDIPKYKLSKIEAFEKARLSEMLPKLPVELRDEYVKLGLTEQQVEVIISDGVLSPYYAAVSATDGIKPSTAKLAANYLTSDVVSLMQSTETDTLSVETVPVFVALLQMVEASELNSRGAKDLLKEVVFDGKKPQELASQRGLLQQNSADDLMPIIDEIVAANASVVEDYKAGKEAALKFLIGQGMKATKGAANPQLLTELFKQKLD